MMLIISLVGVFAVAVAAGPFLGELIATTAPLRLGAPELEALPPYQEVEFTNDAGQRLRGWFFPAGDPASPAVLYAPATAKDQRQGLSLVEPLHQAGYQVLLFSYRGVGRSEGSRFAFSYGARESQDVDAAVRYLSEQRGIQQIGAIGHSAGAVSILLSAARNPQIDALVTAAAYPTLQDIWQVNRPALFPAGLYNLLLHLFELRKDFSRRQVRPLDVVGQISPRPILFINGLADRRVPSDHARLLIEQAGFPKQAIWLPEATHAEVRSPGLDQLAPQIVQFFNDHLK